MSIGLPWENTKGKKDTFTIIVKEGEIVEKTSDF